MKLDLHVHYSEAIGFVPVSIDMVGELVATIVDRGLDGIAITDHYGYDISCAYWVRDIVERDFSERVLIIPGQERDIRLEHVVELFLPNNLIFRFLAHPSSLPADNFITKCAYHLQLW